MSLLPEVTGIEGTCGRLAVNRGLNFGVSSYRIQEQKHVGVNYATNGENGLTQYAVNGMKKEFVIVVESGGTDAIIK